MRVCICFCVGESGYVCMCMMCVSVRVCICSVCMKVGLCVRACVCVYVREREIDRGKKNEGRMDKTEGERE